MIKLFWTSLIISAFIVIVMVAEYNDGERADVKAFNAIISALMFHCMFYGFGMSVITLVNIFKR